MIEFKVIEISTFEDGYFKGIGPDGQITNCYIHNKDRDWNKLPNYLNKTIVVKGSIMTQGSFVVIEIVE